MYTHAILQMLSWPLLILISYWIIKLVVHKAEKKLDED